MVMPIYTINLQLFLLKNEVASQSTDKFDKLGRYLIYPQVLNRSLLKLNELPAGDAWYDILVKNCRLMCIINSITLSAMKSTFLDNYGICLILLEKKIVVEVSSEGILVVQDNIFTSIYLYILKVTKNTLKECYFFRMRF